MKRTALACAALATLGLAACADYYDSGYGYGPGRTYYGNTGGYYGDSYCSRGWYDSLGYYHPPTCSRYRYRYGYGY